MRRLAAVLFLLPAAVLAHGGEDHGAAKAAAPRAAGGGIRFPKESQFLLEVRTQPVAKRPVESRLVVPGKVVPRNDKHAQLYSPVTGRVLATRIPLPGERVRKGQVLAVVQQSLSGPESGELAGAKIRAETGVGQAKAALDQARRRLARIESLEGVVAKKELQDAELAVKIAEQDYERAVRELELYSGKGQGLTRFPLVSPIDGVLVEAHATAGEQVEPSRALFTVLDASVVWIEASVFADDVGRVESAKEALVHVDAYPEQYFPARLFNLGQMVDEATRTVKTIFEVKNPDRRLRPGMFASVAIGAGGKQDVLAVPDAAVVDREGRKVVYVKTGPEEFDAREVALGARDGAFWAVRQGLEEGERVVVRGTYQLRSAEGGQ